MRLIKAVGILTITLALSVAMLAPVFAADDNTQQIIDMRDELKTIINTLAAKTTLTKTEIDNLRIDLVDIYFKLDTLASEFEEKRPPVSPGKDWVAYTDINVDYYPENAHFTQWSEKADINLNWGEYGELVIEVVNGYQTECRIYNSYSGDVKTKIRAEPNGDIIIDVNDEIGDHDFLIKNGGLGPVYVRDRDGYKPPQKQVSPVPNPNKSTPATSNWYQPYRDLVSSKQIEESAAMEWFIDMYNSASYSPPALEILADRLDDLGNAPDTKRIGWIAYGTGNAHKEIDIPDPRYNVGGFVHVLNKIRQRISDGDHFEIHVVR